MPVVWPLARLLTAWCGAFLFVASAGEAARPALQPAGEGTVAPPGFSVSVVAQNPMIACPAAMCLAPDGRIFVCEEYIHAEIPGRKRDVVKVLIGAEQGGVATQAITLAENLNSVQGVCFHDGKLYIAHSPVISVLPVSADNVPGTMSDLITGIGYGAKGFSPTHQASGLKVFDGKLYAAMGDQGCDIQTREGGRIHLDTGAILRCNLDGSGLEVFAHGFRNIYDVAIDHLGNAFTRENDDDGGGYNCRSYHVISGGYYGWPWRYRDSERTPPVADVLPCARDQGKGSSTGLIAIRNPAFPAPFNDGLLFCDWTRGGILFSQAVASGATFDLPEQPFVMDGKQTKYPYQFRPTAVQVAADGSLLVADMGTLWLHSREPVGRILRVRYTGTDAATPVAVPASALGTATAEADLLTHLTHSDALMRARAVRLLGDRRLASARGALEALVDDVAPPVRLAAVTALTDLRDPASTPVLVQRLAKENDRWVRFAIVRAVRLSTEVPELVAAVATAAPADQVDLLQALRGRYELPVSKALIALTDAGQSATVRVKATELLGVAAKRTWHQRSGGGAPKEPVPAGVWPGTDDVLVSLRRLARGSHADVRATALAGLNKLADRGVVEGLLSDLRAGTVTLDDGVAQILIRSAGADLAEAVIAEYVARPTASPELRLDGVRSLGLGKRAESLALLRQMLTDAAQAPLLRATVADALGRRKDAAGIPALVSALSDPVPEIQAAAARALGLIAVGGKAPAAGVREALIAAAERPEVTVQNQALVALWRLGDQESLIAASVRLAAIPSAEVERQRELITAASGGPRPQVEPVLLYLLEQNNLGRAAIDAALQPIRRWASSDFGLLGPPQERAAAIARVAEYRAKTYPQWQAPTTAAAPAGRSEGDLQQRQARLAMLALTGGDPARGAEVFRRSGCLLCHRVGNEGVRFGPDLNEVGTSYARQALIDAVLNPSSQIFEGYQLQIITLKSGEVVSGIVQAEEAGRLTIAGAGGLTQVVATAEVDKRSRSRTSAMPAGLINAMSDPDFVDLIAYLESRKKQ
jgi:putative membrane-bound dehydrogenase-like protein